MLRKIYELLSSVRLALALLIIILTCCLAGVTVLRGQRAWELIFYTIWFNGLLVLLVVNVAFCFFGRIWGRRVTFISLGMILFHLSFVAILGGVVYNSLYSFRGMMRITEGEVLQSDDPASYDFIEAGRFFSYAKLRGETALVKMHRDLWVDGAIRKWAYEIEVGEGTARKKGMVYPTHGFTHDGISYFDDREGYSLLVMLYDRQGNNVYGAHVPLQSYRQDDGSYHYATGTRERIGKLLFPQPPLHPLFVIQAAYIPTPLKERAGEVLLTVWPFDGKNSSEKNIAEAKKPIGERIRVGAYALSSEEVRYWVIMAVRHDPGKPVVLASLWFGFGGLIITFIGRMRRSSSSPPAVNK